MAAVAHAETRRPWDDGRPLVLIIDADETSRDLYGHWFAAIGFQEMCAVGTLGLTLALRSDIPALIVTELQARDLTLTNLFVRLRSDASTRCIPVVVLTSCCDQAVLSHAKTSGAAAVLPKLADFDLLRSWIDALCPP
jgi:CheY-like chemotaxis protein